MKLKVYGGHLFGGSFGPRGSRVIIATTSWKRASEILKTSLSHIKNYWSITGNAHELKIALAKPHVPLFVSDKDAWPAEPRYKEATWLIT